MRDNENIWEKTQRWGQNACVFMLKYHRWDECSLVLICTYLKMQLFIVKWPVIVRAGVCFWF